MSAEQLEKEIAELEKQVADLKAKLGIDKTESADEKTRIKSVFDKYDADKNGFIDKKEFEVLAFETGTPASLLSPDNIDATFKQMSLKDADKITFEEFFAWYSSEKSVPTSEGALKDLGVKTKLQSKVWLKSYESFKSKHGKDSKEKTELKSSGPENLLSLELKLGDFKEAKTTVGVRVLSNPDQVDAVRKEIGAAEGKGFIAVDFALQPEAKDESVQEFIATVSGLLDSVPFDQMIPIPGGYAKHSFSTATIGEEKTIRIYFESGLSLGQAVAMFTGLDANVFQQALSLQAEISTPLSLSEIVSSENFSLKPEAIQAAIKLSADVDRERVAQIKDTFGAFLGEREKRELEKAFAGFEFFRGLNVSLQFQSLDKYLATLPSSDDTRTPIGTIREVLTRLPEMPVTPYVQAYVSAAGQAASLIPIPGLYEGFRSVIAGPRRIHVQANPDLAVQLNIAGLDVGRFLPSSA